ncbi:MAG: hypothetical protein AABZ31_07530 [Bdellovibrionota bacterium]
MDNFTLSPPVKLALLVLLISTVMVFYCSRMTTTPSDVVTPCSKSGFPGRCYKVPEGMCNIVWDRTEETCNEFIKTLNLPPGRLMGPIVTKCRLMHYDKPFVYGRESNAECDQIFQDLELWKRRNNF